MTDQDYKRAFALLTEKLGRVPTTRDKEWVELSERLRKSYLPAEETCSRREAHHSGATNAEAINGASPTTQTATTASHAGKPSRVMSAGKLGPMTTGAEPQRRRPVLEAETPAAGRPVSNAREGTGEALSGPGIIPTGVGGLDSLPGTNPPSRIDDGAMVGARGPGGGIYAKCGSCGRVWEREKKRGRPARMCGGCK